MTIRTCCSSDWLLFEQPIIDELKKAEEEIARFNAKLGNEQFVAKAPEDVLTEQREKLADATALAARLKEAVTRLA